MKQMFARYWLCAGHRGLPEPGGVAERVTDSKCVEEESCLAPSPALSPAHSPIHGTCMGHVTSGAGNPASPFSFSVFLETCKVPCVWGLSSGWHPLAMVPVPFTALELVWSGQPVFVQATFLFLQSASHRWQTSEQKSPLKHR